MTDSKDSFKDKIRNVYNSAKEVYEDNSRRIKLGAGIGITGLALICMAGCGAGKNHSSKFPLYDEIKNTTIRTLNPIGKTHATALEEKGERVSFNEEVRRQGGIEEFLQYNDVWMYMPGEKVEGIVIDREGDFAIAYKKKNDLSLTPKETQKEDYIKINSIKDFEKIIGQKIFDYRLSEAVAHVPCDNPQKVQDKVVGHFVTGDYQMAVIERKKGEGDFSYVISFVKYNPFTGKGGNGAEGSDNGNDAGGGGGQEGGDSCGPR